MLHGPGRRRRLRAERHGGVRHGGDGALHGVGRRRRHQPQARPAARQEARPGGEAAPQAVHAARGGRRLVEAQRRGGGPVQPALDLARAREQRVAQPLGLGAARGVELQGALQHPHDGRGQLGPRLGERHAVGLVQVDEVARRAGAVGVGAGQRLVRHQRGGPDVGRAGDRPAAHLLRRHVGQRAEQAVVGRRVGVVDERDAEVGQLEDAVVAHQHVAGLHVAMHDSTRVRMPECVADRRDRPQDRGVVQLTRAEHPGEVLAPHQLEDDVHVVVVLGGVEQPHDGGVIERRGDAHLAARPALEPLVARDRLERDRAAVALVDRLEDGRRAADAEHVEDAEALRDDALGEQRRRVCRAPSGVRRHAPPRRVREGTDGRVAKPSGC